MGCLCFHWLHRWTACYTKNRLLNDCLCGFVSIMQTFSLIIWQISGRKWNSSRICVVTMSRLHEESFTPRIEGHLVQISSDIFELPRNLMIRGYCQGCPLHFFLLLICKMCCLLPIRVLKSKIMTGVGDFYGIEPLILLQTIIKYICYSTMRLFDTC